MIKSIDEIVKENIKFRIPELQRSYVWNEVQWEQFWEDIRRVYYSVKKDKNSKEQHFMGCLIIDSEKNIIDGQQRLTTVKIFMDYLFDLKNYRENKEGGKDYIQIDNTNAQKPQMQSEILEDEGGFEKEKYTQVYNFFASKYSMAENIMDLDMLICIVKHRLFFLVRELKESEDRNSVFESINATGKPLQFADLVLNYLCELADGDQDGIRDEVIKKRWQKIITSVYASELLETTPEIDAMKFEEEQSEEGLIDEEAEEEEYENEDELNIPADADQKAEIKANPLKLKKFFNALHCLTLPRTESMPESIDSFRQVFERIIRSFSETDNDKISADFILSQMEEWLPYYLAYLRPQNFKKKEFYCEELYYLSILGNTNLIPVTMRTLKKYKGSKNDCKNVLYGIVCCQIVKNVYFERDNTHEMDKKSILADYLYESVNCNREQYLRYLVNVEKLKEGLENDKKYLDNQQDKNELWKVPFNKKICKFLLAIGYDRDHALESKKLIAEESEEGNTIVADYCISPENMDEKHEPVYKSFNYDGKTVGELWNIVLRRKDGTALEEPDDKRKDSIDNIDRLKKVYKAVYDYCKICIETEALQGSDYYFVKFVLNDNVFSEVHPGCFGKEEVEEDTTGMNCYFGFVSKEDLQNRNRRYFTIYPKSYFGNNNTIEYILDGKSVGGENDKRRALFELKDRMEDIIGKESMAVLVKTMTEDKYEEPSNLIYITKEIMEQYVDGYYRGSEKKKLPKSTKNRWESYFASQIDPDDHDGIVVNLNTDVQVITKNTRKIYLKYIEIAKKTGNLEKDYKIGFFLKMRRPEMHYINGVRMLTQYRNIADPEKYKNYVLNNEKKTLKIETDVRERVHGTCPELELVAEDRYFKASLYTIKEICRKYKNLTIPEYQRDYVWNEDDWKTLTQAIVSSGKENPLNLGMIILFENGGAASIVDGQQRLTTIFTLRNCCGLEENVEFKIKGRDASEKCKSYMEQYVANKSSQEKENFLTKLNEISVYVLSINCIDSIYQYRVFSSVNGKGKKLTVEEKVKNYLFKKSGGSKNEKEIKKIASDRGFIKAFIERREKKHISDKLMYAKFKEYFEKLLENKKAGACATVYRELQFYKFLKTGNVRAKDTTTEKNPVKKEFWIWLKLYQHLKVDTADALLLDILFQNMNKPSLDGVNEKKLCTIVDMLKKIDMIYFLLYIDDLNGLGKKSINSKIPQLIGREDIRIGIKTEEEELKLIDDPVLYHECGMNNDMKAYIWEKIKETDLTRTMRVNVSRFLLMVLELWNGLDLDVAFSFLTQNKIVKCDVEHIFPANPDKEYSGLNHPNYLYTLQNVCLLESDINRSKALGNGMMIVHKKSDKGKERAKLGYIWEDQFKILDKKYRNSELGFPRMFYNNDDFNENYVTPIDNSDNNEGYYYSIECANRRLEAIYNNIVEKNSLYSEMLASVLPKNLPVERLQKRE